MYTANIRVYNCKSQIPILIHVFPILMNVKVFPFLFYW